MDSFVEVEEQTHKYWKAGTYLSAIISVLLFIIFWYLSSAFWTGVFRLASFAFFALAVLGYLNIMNGPLSMLAHFSDDILLVSYKRGEKTVHEEQFDAPSIDHFIVTQSNQNLIQQFFLPHSATLKVAFNDTENKIYVFEFGGRPLFLEEPMLKKIEAFIQKHGFRVQNV